jgi:hypothetical protein
MHPGISYELAQARIADLRRQAQREGLARAAAHSSPSAPQPNGNTIPDSVRSWFGNRRRAYQTRVTPRPAREPRCDHGSHQSRRPTMSSTSFDLSISAARADALFTSALQRSDEPSARQVRQAVAAAIGTYGDLGCTARVAQAYGEHPETAVTRMRWVRTAVAGAFGGSQPAHPPKPGQYTGPCGSRAA